MSGGGQPASAKSTVELPCATFFVPAQDGDPACEYEILKRLANRSATSVFLGRIVGSSEHVAIKLVKVAEKDTRPFKAQLDREWQLLKKLTHRNIVKNYQCGIIDRVHYLIMEFVPGPCLETLVAERGPLEYRQAAHFAAEIANGLAHAHAAGVVHRDVKPGNVLLGKKDMPKLIDFGASHFQPIHDVSASKVYDSMLLGTVDYMAPEQAQSCYQIDGRADIYSLGCTLYYLLTGRPPFEGSMANRLLKHRNEPAPSILSRRPTAPPELVAMVERMMAKKPEDRYATAASVRDELKAWIGTLPPVEGTPPSGSSAPKTDATAPRSKPTESSNPAAQT